MCIILYSTIEPGYSLVLSANRDEFLARPTRSAAFHDFATASSSSLPTVTARYLSGIDLMGGGTWLGVALPSEKEKESQVRLRFATLTNFTETPLPPSPVARPSRGSLVKEFLTGSASMVEYLATVEKVKEDYVGFNLLVGELAADQSFKMGYVSNRTGSDEQVGDQRRAGLSNATLGGDIWPKVKEGRRGFDEAVAGASEGRIRRMELAVGSSSGGDERVDRATERNDLIQRLFQVMSSSPSSPITHRTHLRHTILVEPIFFDPRALVLTDTPPPPFPPLPLDASSSLSDPATPPTPHWSSSDKVEGEEQGHWYATRVQTVLLIQSGTLYFVERDAFVLQDGKPVWSGVERRFECDVV